MGQSGLGKLSVFGAGRDGDKGPKKHEARGRGKTLKRTPLDEFPEKTLLKRKPPSL